MRTGGISTSGTRNSKSTWLNRPVAGGNEPASPLKTKAIAKETGKGAMMFVGTQ